MANVIGQIFEESDYSIFKRLDDNRDVLSSRVNKLIASISGRYILNPIIVNEKMEVIDGQGRFEARKYLGLPIHYIIAYGSDSDDCRRMNKYNTSWKTLDFAKSYAKKGVKSYQLLLKLCDELSLPISTILRLSNHASKSKDDNNMNSFERGGLILSEEDYEKVIENTREAEDIRKALLFTERLNDAFRTGVKICSETEGYDHERMIKKCSEERSTFCQMSNLRSQVSEFERIYNKGAKKNFVYFSDYFRKAGRNTRDYSLTQYMSDYRDTDVSSLN